MYKFFLDISEVPEDIELEVQGFKPFNKKRFIESAKKYVDRERKTEYAFYGTGDKSNNGLVHYFKEEPQNGYEGFFFVLELSSTSLLLAITEGIQIAEKLQVNCFEILEGSIPVCYMYLIQEWTLILENSKYRDILSIYQKNKLDLKDYHPDV